MSRIATIDEVRAHRSAILELAQKYHAFNVRVTGSVARDEAHSDSDVDFLVDFKQGSSIWDLVGLWRELGELLGVKVNIIAEDTPDDTFMRSVLHDAVPL